MKKLLLTLGLMAAVVCDAMAQEAETSLSRHNFFYAGQSKQRRMFIVKDGQVNWSYDDQLKRGEISDAVLMTDGNILVAHQYGIAEIAPTGATVWCYEAPEGTEASSSPSMLPWQDRDRSLPGQLSRLMSTAMWVLHSGFIR